MVQRMTDNSVVMLSDCTQLVVRVPKPIREKIQAEAARRLLTQSDVVREAVLQYLADLEETRRADREEVAA